jgi:hypothetical protein
LKNEKIDYKYYKTENNEYLTWIDKIFIKKNTFVKIFFLGFLIYLGGLLISISIGFHYEYIKTKIFYVGIFGILWVVSFFRFGSRSIHEAYELLRPCFLVSDDEYKCLIHKWFSKLSNLKLHLLSSLFFFCLAIGVIYVSFFMEGFLNEFKITSLRPAIVEPYWFSPENILVKALIISYYAIFAALLLGTTAVSLLMNLFFLLDLRKFAVIPLPNVVRFRLRKITNFYLMAATTWFVGVSLFGLVLFDSLDTFSICFLILLSALGTATFLVPQFIYRSLLFTSHELYSKYIIKGFYDLLHIKIKERETVIKISNDILDKPSLIELMEASTDAKLWVYDANDILIFILGQATPIISVFVRNTFKIG